VYQSSSLSSGPGLLSSGLDTLRRPNSTPVPWEVKPLFKLPPPPFFRYRQSSKYRVLPPKIGVHNRAEATAYAYRHGIDLDPGRQRVS
jgi:hypothetical protein